MPYGAGGRNRGFHHRSVSCWTVETHDGPGVSLQETLRYAHGTDHVRGAIASAGLTLLTLEPASTRTEKGAPVPGLVAVARRQPSEA